jgi:hypothetical protein
LNFEFVCRSSCHVSSTVNHESFFVSKILKNCLSRNLGITLLHKTMSTNSSQPKAMPTGAHYPMRTQSVMIDLVCPSIGAQSSSESNEPGIGSNNQMELSRYKRLYSQAREDLDKLNGQAKRRYVKNVAPSICAHRNNLLGKLLAGRSWGVAYASSSHCLTIYQQSSTSTTYTASYVRAKLMKRTKNLQILK